MLCWIWIYFLFMPSSSEFYTHCILLSARLGISRRGCSDRLGRWHCRFHCRYWECISPLREHLARVWKTLLCPHLSVRRLLLPLRDEWIWLWRHNFAAPCLLLDDLRFPRIISLRCLGCFVHRSTKQKIQFATLKLVQEVGCVWGDFALLWLLLSYCLSFCFGKICPEFLSQTHSKQICWHILCFE